MCQNKHIAAVPLQSASAFDATAKSAMAPPLFEVLGVCCFFWLGLGWVVTTHSSHWTLTLSPKRKCDIISKKYLSDQGYVPQSYLFGVGGRFPLSVALGQCLCRLLQLEHRGIACDVLFQARRQRSHVAYTFFGGGGAPHGVPWR